MGAASLSRLYTSYFKLQVCWLHSLLGPSMGLTSARPLQAAFKSAPCRFVTRITYFSKLIGPRSLAAFLQFELFRVDCMHARVWQQNASHQPIRLLF
ncbi:Uncharacterised protein [Yersinia enterocolitica]|nr:Uncharacterised protein [Yersinia enterocolitica]CNH36112.1 Uncharacterised protein [Yersinia enterocolitica]